MIDNFNNENEQNTGITENNNISNSYCINVDGINNDNGILNNEDNSHDNGIVEEPKQNADTSSQTEAIITVSEISTTDDSKSYINEAIENKTADIAANEVTAAKTVPELRKRRKSNLKTYVSLVLAASIISGSAVGGGLYYKFNSELQKQASAIEKLTSISTAQASSSGSSGLVKTDFTSGSTVTNIAKKVGPSIVGIRITIANSGRSFMGDTSSQAEGSGIIISSDGYIVTNYHVVQYADPKSNTSSNTTLEVFLSDKTQAKAMLLLDF
jgi:hypothetical protein